MDINQKEKNRFLFLELIYKSSNGNTDVGFSVSDLGTELCLDQSETQNIVNYLLKERLVEYLGTAICITHDGVKEIEYALKNPDKPTEHFLPINIINNTMNIGNVSHSNLQQGTTNSTINSHFNINKISELDNIIKEIKNIQENLGLANHLQQELEADIQTLEIQRESPKPKNNIIKESLTSIRNILEGAAGNVIATIATPVIAPLVNTITHFINNL